MKREPKIIAALEATGLPWALEQGRGHFKIRLAGRLAGVVSVNPSPRSRASLNVISQIKRIAGEAS